MPTGCDGVIGDERSHYASDFVGIRARTTSEARERFTRETNSKRETLRMQSQQGHSLISGPIRERPNVAQRQLFATCTLEHPIPSDKRYEFVVESQKHEW